MTTFKPVGKLPYGTGSSARGSTSNCHPQRSEGSRRVRGRMLRYAQHDAALHLFCLVALSSLAFRVGGTARADDLPKRSPFEYIRWKDVTPEVKVRDHWYELKAINDIPVQDILEYCRKFHFEKWQRRFDEDLVQIMSDMGQPLGKTVALSVRGLKSRDYDTLKDVPLTEENRKAIMDAKYGDLDESGGMVGTPGVQRQHRDTPHPAFAGLAKRIETAQPWATERLTFEQVAEDLDHLEWHLANRYAYVDRVGFDYKAALDTIRLGAKGGISRGAFGVQLMKFLALFGDGHTRLNRWSDINKSKYITWSQFLPAGFVPFAMADVDGRIVAYTLNPKHLIDDDYPFVRSLDGVPIERWLEAAGTLVAHGSPQFQRAMSVKFAAFAGFVRAELGLPQNGTQIVELESPDGSTSQRYPLKISPSPHIPSKGAWVEHKRLDGNIGYLRMSRMEAHPAFIAKLTGAMSELRTTRRLIVDLRGNSGGPREAARTLFAFFLAHGEPPYIANVAAYRVPPNRDRNRPEGFLATRFLYPITSQYWSESERAAIKHFAESFKPEWPVPHDRFSDWHYFALSSRKSPASYHYNKPIAVLMDAGCFDTTDVLLGAFKGRRNVALVGTPSGGGSGRGTNLALLINSGFRIQFSSMVSFRPDGKLYDGRGITPDIRVAPTLSDALGKTDTVREAALKLFRR